MTREVPYDPEWHRINALPRRTYQPHEVEYYVDYYTNALRMPRGTERLFPVQAIALHEAATYGGILGPIPAGHGKTLISLLLPIVMNVPQTSSALLLMPSGLLEKTKQDIGEYAQHWRLPDNLFREGYEKLGREAYADYLERSEVVLIICDEAHRLRNPQAAGTRRVMRYVKANPHVRCVFMSGTLFTEDLGDLTHLGAMSLREGSPIPYENIALTAFKGACKAGELGAGGVGIGALRHWPFDGDVFNEVDQARAAIRKRIVETPGVVAAQPHDGYGGSLYISPIELPPTPVVEQHFERLRTLWETPDGWALTSPIEVWRKARELALGMHYAWSPPPPRFWLAARASYASLVRAYLEQNDDCDSELQVRNKIASGEGGRDMYALAEVYAHWLKVEPHFQVNPIVVWHDDTALATAAAWAKKSPGVVWTDHTFFARELSRRTGLEYYGEDGVEERSGAPIGKHPGNKSIIASVSANGTGRNLQMFSRALVVSPRSNHLWEQLLARHHRTGQKADQVTFEIFIACRENLEAIPRAVERARTILGTIGARQKLLEADLIWPPTYPRREGWAWESNHSQPKRQFDLDAELDRLDALDVRSL